MQDGDLVSVIIPTYNRARSIRRAINGVLAQTYKNIEVIVVDDCSIDQTVDILKSMEDPRLRLLQHDQNRGAGAARHTGVMAASANLIAFQDSDDAWLPDKLEVQVSALADLPDEYIAIFSPEIIYGRDGEGSHKIYGPRRVACVPGPGMKIAGGDLSREFLYGNFMTLQTVLLKKAAYMSIGGFDLSLPNNEDWDFNIRLSRFGLIGYVDTPQVIVFDSPDGISKKEHANAYSTMMIYGKIKRYDPTAPPLAALSLDISRQLMEKGKPRSSERFLRKAIDLQPRRLSLYLRLILTRFPVVYNQLIIWRRKRMLRGHNQ